jgi:alpha-ribazole phosphatase
VRTFLIRHPKPAIAEGICYGRSDIGLAEDAAERAAALRPLLPSNAPLWSSPLRRCLELARALHPEPVIDARLVEMNFGAWELRRWDDIPRHEIDAWAADPGGFAPPGGESPGVMRLRVAASLRELPEVAVVVAHGGVLRACAAELAGIEEWHTLQFHFGSLSLIEDGRLVWQNSVHAI